MFPPLIAVIMMAQPDSSGALTGISIIFVWLPLIILVYVIAGFLTVLIGGWLYNLAAKAMGGIQIELED